jgi:glycosyltransferase involved in cell wall biosynthesis
VQPAENTATARPSWPSQTIVIPTYNEAERIEQTIDTVLEYLAAQPYDAELIVVNDGSTDDTLLRARARASDCSSVRVLDVPHAGKATAVRHGVAAARCDLIAFSDADLATPIGYLAVFRDRIAAGADVVIGSREGEGAVRIGEPLRRHIMGRVFNALVRILLLPGIQDTQCGFKMFTNHVAKELFAASRLYAGSESAPSGARVTAFDVELLTIARRRGHVIDIVPVAWTFGTNSKVSAVGDTMTNLRDVLTVKWNDLRGSYD